MNPFLRINLVLIISNFVRLTNCDVECYKAAKSKEINEKLLKRSNHYRSLHSADPLILDNDLIVGSEKWSRNLAEINQMKHSPANDYGENLYYSESFEPFDVSKMDAVKSWYDEVKDYDYKAGGFSHETGHFTQLVWKSSKKVGCGVCTSSDNTGRKRTYVTCRYEPAGNVKGLYRENVRQPKRTRSSAKNDKHNNTTELDHEEHPLDIENERMRTIVNILLYTSLVVTILPVVILIAVITKY